jgi:uncharacterized protein involved in exopolysaccharide biosynthesis
MTRKIRFKDGSHKDNADMKPDIFGRDTEQGEFFRINLFELAGLCLRNKRWIFGTAAACMLIISVVVFLTPNRYTSVAKILPSGKTDQIAELKDLAGLAGFSSSDENSSELYPIILTSRQIGQTLVGRSFDFRHGSARMSLTLEQYFNKSDGDYLLAKLAEITSVRMDKKMGVIDIAVETKYPGLSQAILTGYIDELENYNIHKRKSQAKQAALYLETQLQDVEKELKASEDKLEQFQNKNRGWASSTNPDIVKLLSRFRRDIEIQSTTYLTLRQEYELAKLNAQKDIPIVRVLDSPSLPSVKSGPRRLSTIIIAGLTGFVLSFIVIVVIDAIGKAGHGPDREAYQALRKDLSKELATVNRILGRSRKDQMVGT